MYMGRLDIEPSPSYEIVPFLVTSVERYRKLVYYY